MSAPANTPRGTPAGIKLRDGYSTKLSFANNPTFSVWEKEVQPPGIDGGDPIPQTTMHNTSWRTFESRSLLTLTPFDTTVAYDPAAYTQFQSLCNRNQSCSVTLPDGSTIDFFAIPQKFVPSACKEGDQPEATLTVCPTNYDPVAHVEAAPVVTSVAGT